MSSPTGPGSIILIGGINDVLIVTRSWRYGFAKAGLSHRLLPFQWQQGLWATLCFADLWNTRHHHQEAARLAQLIRQTRRDYPDEPIHIVAHSAGTAITAYALERLDSHERICSAVFVGSGLSPRYDLSRAISATTAGLLTVQSYLDFFFLGIGTMLLGTADRVWTPAAGMIGFAPPRDVQQATRLITHHWRMRDARTGWIGGHLSIAAPGFVRTILVPWLQQAEEHAASGG